MQKKSLNSLPPSLNPIKCKIICVPITKALPYMFRKKNAACFADTLSSHEARFARKFECT